MDVVEIGTRQLEMGGVYPVKPLGVYAMIDDGELDWKVRAVLGACGGRVLGAGSVGAASVGAASVGAAYLGAGSVGAASVGAGGVHGRPSLRSRPHTLLPAHLPPTRPPRPTPPL